MKSIELINPKSDKRRMVSTERPGSENLINCLKRAGYVPAATYRAPKKKVVEPEKTLAKKVEEQAVKVEVDGVELEAEIAVHGEGDAKDEPDMSTNDDAKGESEGEDEKVSRIDALIEKVKGSPSKKAKDEPEDDTKDDPKPEPKKKTEDK